MRIKQREIESLTVPTGRDGPLGYSYKGFGPDATSTDLPSGFSIPHRKFWQLGYSNKGFAPMLHPQSLGIVGPAECCIEVLGYHRGAAGGTIVQKPTPSPHAHTLPHTNTYTHMYMHTCWVYTFRLLPAGWRGLFPLG